MKKRAPRIKRTNVDLLDALDMIPRWTRRDTWRPDGKKMLTNSKVLPDRVERSIRKIMEAVDRLHFKSTIQMVDVSKDNVWVLHSALIVRSLMYLCRRRWAWQDWKLGRLPIYLRYNGKIIIWNGTHRMTLGRLCHRKIRARMLDLNEFSKWSKTHKQGWDDKVINYQAKKKPAKKGKKRG